MKTVSFVSHPTEDFIDDLKLACLYYDKITVPENTVIRGRLDPTYRKGNKGLLTHIVVNRPFTQPIYQSTISLLAREGIVETNNDVGEFLENPLGIPEQDGLISIGGSLIGENSVERTIRENLKVFFKPGTYHETKEDFMGLLDEANYQLVYGGDSITEYDMLVATLEKPGGVGVGGRLAPSANTMRYLTMQLKRLVAYLSNGQNCVTSSDILHQFLGIHLRNLNQSEIYKKLRSENIHTPSIAFDLVKMNVPNISRLSVEDILDIRLKSKDELFAFQASIDALEYDISNTEIGKFNPSHYVAKNVTPQIEDLKNKMEGIDRGLGVKILNELRNPRSYSPLILSFANVPNSLLILISLGLVTASTVLEYLKDKKSAQANGFYYLLKLREQ